MIYQDHEQFFSQSKDTPLEPFLNELLEDFKRKEKKKKFSFAKEEKNLQNFVLSQKAYKELNLISDILLIYTISQAKETTLQSKKGLNFKSIGNFFLEQITNTKSESTSLEINQTNSLTSWLQFFYVAFKNAPSSFIQSSPHFAPAIVHILTDILQTVKDQISVEVWSIECLILILQFQTREHSPHRPDLNNNNTHNTGSDQRNWATGDIIDSVCSPENIKSGQTPKLNDIFGDCWDLVLSKLSYFHKPVRERSLVLLRLLIQHDVLDSIHISASQEVLWKSSCFDDFRNCSENSFQLLFHFLQRYELEERAHSGPSRREKFLSLIFSYLSQVYYLDCCCKLKSFVSNRKQKLENSNLWIPD